MKNEIMVSVACITFNHEAYIAEAIESFLEQKTNFKFEILIHDDASTDRTPEILKEYEKRYPDLIKVIYQSQNQYSQGVDVDFLITQKAIGRYLAICEGDDFWIDPQKLQRQFDFMEKCPQCSLCVHNAYIVNQHGKRKKILLSEKKSRDFSTEEVIEGGGALFATSSLFYRRRFDGNKPLFYQISPVGDYPLAINLALQGKVHYLPQKMSVYRVGVEGSWTETEMDTFQKRKKHYEEIANVLDELNAYTGYCYQQTIEKTKTKNEVKLLVQCGKFSQLKSGKYHEVYRDLHRKEKFKIFVKEHFPNLLKKIQFLRAKYK